MERIRAGLKLSAVLVAFILLVAYGPKIIVGCGHQAQGLWQRATGSQQSAEAVSWDAVKEWASSKGQVLPEPTKAQLARSKATSTPIAQIQAQDLLQHVQQTVYKQAGDAKNFASDAAAAAADKAGEYKDAAGDKAGAYKDAAADKAGEYKDAAGSKAGEYLDAAKRRALPAPTFSQRFWSAVTFKPVEQIQAEALYGDVKGRVSDAAASGQQKAGEVYEGARSAAAPPKESTWAKMKRLATGRSQAQAHYDAAKESAGDASGHVSQAASEAYEATKAAGNAAASGAASAWHTDPAGKASQAAKDAAGTAYDTAKSYVDAAGSSAENVKDAAFAHVEAGKKKAGDVYDSTIDAAGNTASHARAEAGLSAEKARHSAEELAQKLKHTAQEKLHAAKAEL